MAASKTRTTRKSTTRKTAKVAAEYERTRNFIKRFIAMDEDDLNVLTVWTMGTWCFSPACTWPATYPYMYVTGTASSGKTVLGNDVVKSIARRGTTATGATGPTLFRMLGTYDDETGMIENHAPTLIIDEVDAMLNGTKDEPLRLSLNVGYKLSGSTIPRSAGKTSIDFPCYGPKMLLGIENGHIPDTVATRMIRLDLVKRTQDQLIELGIQPFYSWKVDDEAAEISEQLAQWAKDNSLVLREYDPAIPPGLAARQWEISRSLVQLAHAIGNEDQIRKSLQVMLTRNPERADHRVELFKAIFDLFEETGLDRVTTQMILSKLTESGVRVPGQSGKGLGAALTVDGIAATLVHLPPGHPGIPENGQNKQRGYFKHFFDEAFLKYLFPEDD